MMDTRHLPDDNKQRDVSIGTGSYRNPEENDTRLLLLFLLLVQFY